MAKRRAASRAQWPASGVATVLRLKVTLLDTHPAIWRCIEVPAELTLDKLHDVLQVAMGWTDSHLHDFEKAGVRYAAPHPDGYGEDEDTANVAIGALLKRRKEKLTYQYDFGDSWYHDVMLEEAKPAEPGVTYPRCVAGKRACPPEDVGGPYGYENFLPAISDPGHEDHERMRVGRRRLRRRGLRYRAREQDAPETSLRLPECPWPSMGSRKLNQPQQMAYR